MNKIILVASFILLAGCASTLKTLKYGYLPGGEYPYYQSSKSVDLKGREYKLLVNDRRNGDQISCSDIDVPRDTELEGEKGVSYFENYLKAMIESNNGKVNPDSDHTINVDLQTLSGRMAGALYVRVRGMVEFSANNKSYCEVMADGDKGATVGSFAVDTRKGAFRKLVAGAVRDSLQELMQDLAQKI